MLKNAHYAVEPMPARRILRVTRLAMPFLTQAEVDTSCGEVMRFLDRFGRTTSCLLLDSRAAAGRNDPDFERWFAAYRGGMIVGFVRSAILVATAVGKLQSERILRADKQPKTMRAFTDESLAMAWLHEGLSGPNGPNAL